MSRLQAEMFNRKASNPKNKPDEILAVIGLKPGQSIADIGSGGGYFSLRFAEMVGEKGKVYAVDENQEYLDLIKRTAVEKGLQNVVFVSASEGILDLPENALDLIFMRNVTHHINDRTGYFKNLRKFLKADGRVVIIEYKEGSLFSFHRLLGHHVAKNKIAEEMHKTGYSVEKEFNFLPEQHFTIFKVT